MNLEQKKCVACEGGVPVLQGDALPPFMNQINEGWGLIDEQKIERSFRFENFVEAMTFVNAVAQLSEEEGHHPDIAIHYNQVQITLWTHAIDGLSENDFILARKIDLLTD